MSINAESQHPLIGRSFLGVCESYEVQWICGHCFNGLLMIFCVRYRPHLLKFLKQQQFSLARLIQN